MTERFLDRSPAVTGIASALFVFLAIAFSVLVLAVFQGRANTKLLNEELRTLATAAARTIDGDLHNTIRRPEQLGGKEYKMAIASLVDFHNTFPRITYLYTMIFEGDQVFFILDTAADPRLKTERELEASGIMEEYEHDPVESAKWIETVKAGNPYVDPKLVKDAFGVFKSGSAPFYDSKGNFAGIVGVDYDATLVSSLEQQMHTVVFGALGVGGLVSILVGMFVARLKKVNDFQKAKRQEVEERLEEQGVELISVSDNLSAALGDVETSQLRMRDTLDNVTDGFVLYDKDLRLVACNEKFMEFYGYSDEEVKPGTNFSDLAQIDKKRGLIDLSQEKTSELFKRYSTNTLCEGDLVIKMTNGRWLKVRDRFTPNGNIVSVQTEITDLKQAEEKILNLEFFDTLTELPTLRLAKDRITKILDSTRREQDQAAVFLIALKGLKRINDQKGHEAENYAVEIIAQRFIQCVRKEDTTARISEKIFLVVIQKLKANKYENVTMIGEKLIEAARKSIDWKGDDLKLEANVGISIFPDHGEDSETLIKEAEEALHDAGERGWNVLRIA